MRRILSSPWTYAATYVLLVPLFALLYQAQAEEFFHSTIHLEPGFGDEKDSAIRRLRQAIIRDYRDARRTTALEKEADLLTFQNTTWKSDIREIGVFDLDVTAAPDIEDALVSLEVSIPSRGTSTEADVPSVQSLIISFPLQSTLALDLGNGTVHYKPVAVGPEVAQQPFSVRDVFPRRTGGDINEGGEPLLTIGETLQSDLEELWRSRHGSPSGIAGGFWRFFYLSAVTITTLGYGDIVPIGGWARFLVGLESVLGIVVIGAFLATLYRGAVRGSRA